MAISKQHKTIILIRYFKCNYMLVVWIRTTLFSQTIGPWGQWLAWERERESIIYKITGPKKRKESQQEENQIWYNHIKLLTMLTASCLVMFPISFSCFKNSWNLILIEKHQTRYSLKNHQLLCNQQNISSSLSIPWPSLI